MQSQKRLASVVRSKDLETSQVTAEDDGDTFADDSRIPRLARKYLFERGVQRQSSRVRKDRKPWKMQHDSYIAKIPAPLQPGGRDDKDKDKNGEQSYFRTGSWCMETETGYMNAATLSDGGWTEKSEDACIAGDEGWKGKNPEAWTQLPKPRTDVVNDAEWFAWMNESSSDLCPSKHAPTRPDSVSGNCTDEELSCGTSYPSCTISSSSSSVSPQKHPLFNLLTPRSSNPELDPIPQNSTSPSSPVLPTAILDARLDACITKTGILLAAVREALSSTAGTGSEGEEVGILDHDEGDGKALRDINKIEEEEKEEDHPHSHTTAIDLTPPFPQTLAWKAAGEESEEQRKAEKLAQRVFAQSVEIAVADGIVGVQNWYKVKGTGEAWRQMRGSDREDLVGLVGDMVRDGDVDVGESGGEDADLMF